MRPLPPARALLLALVACATPHPPPVPVPLAPEVVRLLLDRVHEGAIERRSARCEASVRVESSRGSGRLVIVVERPSRLRLEALNLLGQSQAVLVTNGKGYAYFDGDGVERGPASSAILHERFGFDLTPEEAVETLLAAPSFDPGKAHGGLAFGEERWVEAEDRRLGINPEGDLVGLEALGPGGSVRWRVRYERWRDVAGGRYPFLVRLEFPTGERVEVSLKRVELNPSLAPELFELPVWTAQ